MGKSHPALPDPRVLKGISCPRTDYLALIHSGSRGAANFVYVADQPVKSFLSPDYQALVDVLTEVRKEAGVDQEDLSKRLGQARMYIYKCETLRRRVDPVEVLEISKALGLQPLDVFKRWVERL